MTTIKSFTDISQSKVLADILPLESADGFWEYHNKWYSEGDEWEGYEDYPRAEPYLEYTRKENEWKEDKSDVPCWSLAALLSVLPKKFIYNFHTYQFMYNTNAMFYINLDTYDEDTFCSINENLIDACYELIMRLHQLNLLRL